MLNYKISAVSYLNTFPFIYGINNSHLKENIKLTLDYPSICADKLINGEVDIALVPIVVLHENPDFNIISDYCISANGSVDTVCLYSDVCLEEIEEIYLDYQSRTSVELLKILCKEYWNITPKFIPAIEGFENKISGNTAILIIGDRAFSFNQKHQYIYDLSKYWKEYTGLPFVFACWIANKEIDKKFVRDFNNVMQNAIKHIDKVLDSEENDYTYCSDARDYLYNKICYILDSDRKRAMSLFFSKIIS